MSALKNDKTIESVVRNGLCTGCGTCAGICPKDAIKMVRNNSKGVYVPQLDMESCNECAICVEICPGSTVDFKQLNSEIFGKQPEDTLVGNYLNCYIGHATDYDIRHNSASGGLVTALLVFALEEGIIDGALVTKMSEDNPFEPQPFIARTREEIVSASKSKYCPVPAGIALKDILKEDGKFAVVGLPCHIHGIRKAELINKKLGERIALHLGILCGHSDTFSQTEFLLQRYGIGKEDVAQLDYRGHGWPGYMVIHLKDGTQRPIPYHEYITFHALRFFAPTRCALCCDSISRLADITFMDAWLPEVQARDNVGTSIIVSRTEVGEIACQSAMLKQHVKLEEIDSNTVAQSQGRARLSNKDLKACFYLSRLFGGSVPSYNFEFPRAGPINYVRALISYSNMWVASKRYLWRLIAPLVHLEHSAGNIRQVAHLLSIRPSGSKSDS